jgi:hypothetical protein
MEWIGIAFFTHCGTEIVTSDARQVSRVVHQLGVAHGLDARIAHDGLRLMWGSPVPQAIRCQRAATRFGKHKHRGEQQAIRRHRDSPLTGMLSMALSDPFDRWKRRTKCWSVWILVMTEVQLLAKFVVRAM